MADIKFETDYALYDLDLSEQIKESKKEFEGFT